MSGQERKPKIPSPPTPIGTGNLLSSVAPPSQLPNFITSPSIETPMQPVVKPVAMPPINPEHMPTLNPQPVQPVIVKSKADPPPAEAENFSPVIPLSKGQPTLAARSHEGSQATQSPDSLLEPTTPDVDVLGDIMPGSALFTWVKGAVSSGGILQRVAEKAKSSVESMVTTLDPQMKEYLKSGGDMFIVVASDKDVKISPVREAFQTVFGKATVVGYPAQSNVTATQPVGYAAAYAAAKQRIADIRSEHSELTNNVPVVAIESFLQEAVTDRWYDCALLVLCQPSLGIELQLQSQGTPVPGAACAAAREATPRDYEHAQTGYSVTAGQIMADSLQVPTYCLYGSTWRYPVLCQPSLGIELQLQSQGTPVPGAACAAAREATPRDYEHAQTGYSVTAGQIMADSLQVPTYCLYGSTWRYPVLCEPSLGLELQLQSQGTPVPGAACAAAREATPRYYEYAQTGYSVTAGQIMADSLQVPHTEWQEAATGVSRRELLVLAARSLAGSYKRLLAVSANET